MTGQLNKMLTHDSLPCGPEDLKDDILLLVHVLLTRFESMLCSLDVQSVLQFDALLLLYQGYLAMDLRYRGGHHLPPAIPADCRTEQVLSTVD